MTLDQLHQGDEARVVSIRAGHGVQRRLSHLGIHPGDTVRMSGRGAFRGPLLVQIHGSRVALGRGIARHVLVEPLDGSSGRRGKRPPHRHRRFGA